MAIAVTMAIVTPVVAAVAEGGFTDIEDSIFKQDIEWMADNGYTSGCNPPANDEFCPKDPSPGVRWPRSYLAHSA